MISLLIMIVVSGFCIFVLLEVESVIGKKFSVVIVVVMIMGCICVSLLLMMIFWIFVYFFLYCNWLKWLMSMILFSIVMLNRVINLIFVEILNGMFLA